MCFRFLVLATLTLLSCSKKTNVSQGSATSNQAPIPGLDHIPQIVLVLDANTSIEDQWGLPAVDELRNSLSARVEVIQLKTPEQAKEDLLLWSSRAVDMMILGRGLPQKTWTKIQTPQQKQRLTVALNPPPAIHDPRWISLQVDLVKAASLIDQFCQLRLSSHGCDIVGKVSLNDFPKSAQSKLSKRIRLDSQLKIHLGANINNATSENLSPAALSISVQWTELLRHCLLEFLAGRLASQNTYDIDFKSGFLQTTIGPRISSVASDKKMADSFLTQFKLNELSKRTR